MFRRKVAILLVIISLGTVLGFIAGVAPGYFIKGYALYGIGIGFFAFLFLLFAGATFIFQYPKRNPVVSHVPNCPPVFHRNLSKMEKILLSFTCIGLFLGGAILGIICEILIKALGAATAVHFILAAISIAVLLTVLVIILVIELINSEHDQNKQQLVTIEPIRHPQLLSQSGNDTPRANLYHRPSSDYSLKSAWPKSSVNNSVVHSTNANGDIRSASTIQREYQKLLHPIYRFHKKDKVYVNDKHLAEIIGTDGSGFYSIQYDGSGIIDYKNGADLRKAAT